MSRDIPELTATPVPSSAAALERKRGYREVIPIALGEALARESLVEVRELGIAGDNHYNTPRNPPYYVSVPGSIPQLYLRRSVGAKLVEVNARLRELGVEVYLFDAWRPQAIQR